MSGGRPVPTLARAHDTRRIGQPYDVMERVIQLQIFPDPPPEIEEIDPREAIGPDTRVSALYRVRYPEAKQVHLVYHDRHGWYCSEHGPGCNAVSDAVEATVDR